MIAGTAKDLTRTAVIAAVVFGGLYFLSRGFAGRTVEALENTRQKIGAAIGETFFAWFNPAAEDSSLSPTIGFYFPDGTQGAVSLNEIDRLGVFRYWRDGSQWRLAEASSGRRIAIPLNI